MLNFLSNVLYDTTETEHNVIRKIIYTPKGIYWNDTYCSTFNVFNFTSINISIGRTSFPSLTPDYDRNSMAVIITNNKTIEGDVL